jgi:hypothetical protein
MELVVEFPQREVRETEGKLIKTFVDFVCGWLWGS